MLNQCQTMLFDTGVTSAGDFITNTKSSTSKNRSTPQQALTLHPGSCTTFVHPRKGREEMKDRETCWRSQAWALGSESLTGNLFRNLPQFTGMAENLEWKDDHRGAERMGGGGGGNTPVKGSDFSVVSAHLLQRKISGHGAEREQSSGTRCPGRRAHVR